MFGRQDGRDIESKVIGRDIKICCKELSDYIDQGKAVEVHE